MKKNREKEIEVVEMPAVAEAPSLSGVLAQAEIDSQIATARKYPRDVAVFKQKCLKLATLDEETAASCYYSLPRAGKQIEGPSVRLAELALSCYRNCIAQGDISHEDGQYVFATGMARDLENNIAVRVTVRRRITDKNGNRYNDDMITVTGNAAVSVALRNAIFKIVPAAYIKPVFDACREMSAGDAKKLEANKKKAIAYLNGMGIKTPRILEALSVRSVSDITRNDLITLRGYVTAIRDGEADVETVFPTVTKGDRKGHRPVEPEEKKQSGKKTAKRKGKKGTNLF